MRGTTLPVSCLSGAQANGRLRVGPQCGRRPPLLTSKLLQSGLEDLGFQKHSLPDGETHLRGGLRARRVRGFPHCCPGPASHQQPLQAMHTGGGGDGWDQWRELFLVIGNMGIC